MTYRCLARSLSADSSSFKGQRSDARLVEEAVMDSIKALKADGCNQNAVRLASGGPGKVDGNLPMLLGRERHFSASRKREYED